MGDFNTEAQRHGGTEKKGERMGSLSGINRVENVEDVEWGPIGRTVENVENMENGFRQD